MGPWVTAGLVIALRRFWVPYGPYGTCLLLWRDSGPRPLSCPTGQKASDARPARHQRNHRLAGCRPLDACLRELEAGWASCPVTQNGLLHILSQPAYPNHRPVAEVAERLAEACSHPSHHFWPGGISLLAETVVNWRQLLGPRSGQRCLSTRRCSGGGRAVFEL